MAKTSENGLALCVIIIVVVGLFLHYEMGYNLEIFSVGAQRHHHRGNHKNHPRHGRNYRNAPWYHRYLGHHIYTTHTHPQNITKYKEPLFEEYDLNKSGGIEMDEFSSALDSSLGSMVNDKNKYTFLSNKK